MVVRRKERNYKQKGKTRRNGKRKKLKLKTKIAMKGEGR